MDSLNRETILHLIDDRQRSFDLEVLSEIDSTNKYLLNQPIEDIVKICLAESQAEGRGRHGKNWHSPSGSNIYLSFSHRFNMELSELSGLSLVIGITLAETLQKYCQKLIQVKWPNDLLVERKKLSGILIEIQAADKGFCKVVTGLGVNLTKTNSSENSISQPYTSLEQCEPNHAISRNKLIADIVNNMLSAIEVFAISGFSTFYPRWNYLDAWYQQPVVLEIGDRKITGLHHGIDVSGALVLNVDGKLTRWCSGEVSLRRAG